MKKEKKKVKIKITLCTEMKALTRHDFNMYISTKRDVMRNRCTYTPL